MEMICTGPGTKTAVRSHNKMQKRKHSEHAEVHERLTGRQVNWLTVFAVSPTGSLLDDWITATLTLRATFWS